MAGVKICLGLALITFLDPYNNCDPGCTVCSSGSGGMFYGYVAIGIGIMWIMRARRLDAMVEAHRRRFGGLDSLPTGGLYHPTAEASEY